MTGTLASLNRSWQSNKGTVRASGMAGIDDTIGANDLPLLLLHSH